MVVTAKDVRIKAVQEWRAMSRNAHRRYGSMDKYIAMRQTQAGVLRERSGVAQAIEQGGVYAPQYKQPAERVPDPVVPDKRVTLKGGETITPQTQTFRDVVTGKAIDYARPSYNPAYTSERLRDELEKPRVRYETVEVKQQLKQPDPRDYYLDAIKERGMSQDDDYLRERYQQEHPIKWRWDRAESWLAQRTTYKLMPDYRRQAYEFAYRKVESEKYFNTVQSLKDKGVKYPAYAEMGKKMAEPFFKYPQYSIPLKTFSTGYVSGMYHGIREKPLKTSVIVGASYVLPQIGALGKLGYYKYLAPTIPTSIATAGGYIGTTVKVALPVAYAGFKGYQVYQQPTLYSKGYILGETTTTELLPMAVGGYLGSQSARKTLLKAEIWKRANMLTTEQRELFKQEFAQAGKYNKEPVRDLPLENVKTYQGRKLPKVAQEVTKDFFREKGITTGGSTGQEAYYKSLKGADWRHDIDAYSGKQETLTQTAKDLAIRYREAGFTDFYRRGAKFWFKEGGGKFLELHPEKYNPSGFTRESFGYYESPKITESGLYVTSQREQYLRKLVGSMIDTRSKDIKSFVELKALTNYEFKAEPKGFFSYDIKTKSTTTPPLINQKNVKFFGESYAPSYDIKQAVQTAQYNPYKGGKQLLKMGVLDRYPSIQKRFYESSGFKHAYKTHQPDFKPITESKGYSYPNIKPSGYYPAIGGKSSGYSGYNVKTPKPYYPTPAKKQQPYTPTGYKPARYPPPTTYTPTRTPPYRPPTYSPYKGGYTQPYTPTTYTGGYKGQLFSPPKNPPNQPPQLILKRGGGSFRKQKLFKFPQAKKLTPTGRAISFGIKGKTRKSSVRSGLGERFV